MSRGKAPTDPPPKGDSERREQFIAQKNEYLELAREEFPDHADRVLEDVFEQPPTPLEPVPIEDPGAITSAERDLLLAGFLGAQGVAHFAVTGPLPTGGDRHFSLDLAAALSSVMPTAFPVDHPMEGHPEAVARFGKPDGTLKIYDLPIPPGIDKYREQAETNELFAAHNDGLGYGGAIAISMLTADSPPAWGGYTCFQQLVRVSLALANSDPNAFAALFQPDAIVALRPRGKGAIRVTSPVLYVNDRDEPQVFFRIASGEYRIAWKAGDPDLARAREHLIRLGTPFAPDSSFVHLMRQGEGVLMRNRQVVHSRTPFTDGVDGSRRVLARKWFVSEGGEARYKHVPGMNLAARYARLFPEYFRDELLEGDWHFDSELNENVPGDESPATATRQ
jgi:hypothetical protein